MQTLHVIPPGGPNGLTRELDLLLTTQTGDHVHTLHAPRWWDPRAIWQLAALIHERQPDVIAAWGLTALSATVMARGKSSSMLVVRKPLPSHRRVGNCSRLERWLLRRADLLLAASNFEASCCLALGMPAHKIQTILPGIQSPMVRSTADSPHILCAGALLPHKGFYEAIWAFDILQFAVREAKLTIFGEGPQRRRLEAFITRAGLAGRVHLPGSTANITPYLAMASLAWAPTVTGTGVRFVLEAMAAGLPVIASRLPALSDIVIDGETGFLIEPGNQMVLARRTRQVLSDGDLQRRLGEAARTRVMELFPVQSFTTAWTQACAETWAA